MHYNLFPQGLVGKSKQEGKECQIRLEDVFWQWHLQWCGNQCSEEVRSWLFHSKLKPYAIGMVFAGIAYLARYYCMVST